MTSPATYPSGTISTYGINKILNKQPGWTYANQDTWISYIGVDGSIFYLAGPLAPVAGAQDGFVLRKHMGLMSPFELLELKGARQHGGTWTDTVYEPGEILLSLEASGTSPENTRNVIRQWISAWDPSVGNPGYPKQLGKLSIFTPDMGEWWAPVRQSKNISDQFTKDYTYSGRQQFTWECKNYDAFWYGVDSTSSFNMAYNSASYDFEGVGNSSTLNATYWTQTYSNTSSGTCGTVNGAAQFETNGNAVVTDWVNMFHTTSATDNQVVSVRLASATLANLFSPVDPGAGFTLWACSDGTGANGVRLRCGWAFYTLSYFIGGVEHVLVFQFDWLQPLWGETFTLIVGTASNPNQILVQRNGFTVIDVTTSAPLRGSSYRHWGFGGETSTLGPVVISPPPIAQWYASDNGSVTQSGKLPLTNMGDVEAWPRYLVYGPGTFQFGNGPGSTNYITVGPLLQGQVVLITTEPRFRSVVDITPGQPPPTLGIFETLMNDIIGFAINGNIPPLLQQFESFFGIVPPQGSLYSTMKGRFTNPIPGNPYGVPLTTSHIPVTITDGGPTSKVVAAITPRRRWPL